MNKTDLITTRDYVESDKNFVLSTWLRGLRFGNPWFELIDSKIYFKVYHEVLERLLLSGVSIKIACLKDEPDVILGYAVYKGNRLDWVYCKKAWRSIGIAKSLIPQTVSTISHVTEVGKSIWKKYPEVVFDPFNLN